ncbi:magnesium transporter CorA family protein [Planctomyces sp. SH-PL62]|uniref:magnesium transporter CorA family protein n=1 Tax=Planctomyces sp. SH-PL62 TaxID=1636152 RepID=UPI00078BEDB4|nr:magnesium transporter CorA family protein [Planctomyces sp. SH-PL62]AMV38422.1 Magnesium transport protein CorA [Planctomyces sp. SH-PL62]
MARDFRVIRDGMAGVPPGMPGLWAVACLGGVSLERGVPIAEIHDYIKEPDNVVWLDVKDPGPSELAMLIDEFGLHPVGLEAESLGRRRPKVDEFKGYALLITCVAVPGDDPKVLRTTELDLCLGRNFVVSIHRGRVPALEEAMARWMHGGPRLREGVGFLVFAVMDALVASFASFLAGIEEDVEEMEIAVFTRSDEESVRTLLQLKRNLAALRHELQSLRTIFEVLLRRDHPFFPEGAEVYLRDVYDHLLRMLDVLEAGRERADAAMDATLAIGSHRLNKTMKSLSLITVAMAVIGSVFGAYGMNFEEMPLARAPWGFWFVAAGTIVLVTTPLLIGWWRRWW